MRASPSLPPAEGPAGPLRAGWWLSDPHIPGACAWGLLPRPRGGSPGRGLLLSQDPSLEGRSTTGRSLRPAPPTAPGPAGLARRSLSLPALQPARH